VCGLKFVFVCLPSFCEDRYFGVLTSTRRWSLSGKLDSARELITVKIRNLFVKQVASFDFGYLDMCVLVSREAHASVLLGIS